MTLLKNGKELCDCKTDHYFFDGCPDCGEEVERCRDCRKVKASDCECYDIWTQGKAEVQP